VTDKDQRAAIDSDRNTVVAAGAGSGKTRVLAERYLRLVTERGLDLDSILTLTFTRKAQAEMYDRIYRRLSETQHPRAREQLEFFDTARISTLDSFCTALVRGACHRYGVSPDFSVDEVRLQRAAVEVAVQTLMEYRNDPTVSRLVATRNFDAIITQFLADFAVHHLSLIVEPDYADLAREQIAFVGAEITRVCAALNERGYAILAIDAGTASGESVAKAQAALRSMLPLEPAAVAADPEQTAATAAYLASAASFKMPGSNVVNPALVELRDHAGPLKAAASDLNKLAATLGFSADILAVGGILDDFSRRFLHRKRQEGLLSFHDSTEMAVDILARDRTLRDHYKRRIRAIMIDEFQDNNDLQKKLLYLLAEKDSVSSRGVPDPQDLSPEKLFFVGDEKQSIYRFRGADVAVFRRLAAELGHEPLALRTNYRSSPELVVFFNALFPGVFGQPTADYEADFAAIGLKAAAAADTPGPAVPVEFHLYEAGGPGENAEDEESALVSAADAEALAAARRLESGVAAGEFAYADVAVLFRSTTHQGAYERQFRRLGIPFVAADPRGIFLEGPANDYYALLRLCLFPTDRNAYATVLRSPFTGLGDDAFARIMLDGQRLPFPDDAPDDWFADQADLRRFEQGRTLYRELRRRVDTEGIAPILAFLWYQAGYRAVIMDDSAARSCLEHFEYLYALALDADRRRLCLGAFLDELAPRMGTSVKVDGGEVALKPGTVSFMTIHKSKGLEFPVVLVADCGSSGASNHNPKPYYQHPRFGPVVNLKSEYGPRNEPSLNYFYEQSKQEEALQSLAELKRLLYVAATRAERRLFLFGFRKMNKADAKNLDGLVGEERLRGILRLVRTKSNGDQTLSSLYDLVALGLSAPEGCLAEYAVFAIPAINLAALARPPLTPPSDQLDAFFRRQPLPMIPELPRTTTPSLMKLVHAERAAAQRESGRKSESLPALPIDGLLKQSALENAFGTLCHHSIACLLDHRKPDIPAGLAEPFRSAELDAAARSALQAQAIGLAEAFLQSTLGAQAQAALRRRSEFSFLLPLSVPGNKPILVKGSVDLLFEFEGRCLVVDFKTDRNLDPEEHRVQLECYRAAASAFSDFPVETWLVYLRDARSVRLDSAVTPSELTSLAETTLSREAAE